MSVALELKPSAQSSLSSTDSAFAELDSGRLEILLVEDATSDALLLRLSLDALNLPYRLRTIRSGDEVLPWLARGLKNQGHGLPDVILLDLGLPCVDGFEILEDLASADPAIRAIPIVILTGYEHFEYIRQSYRLCVPAYITKPCTPGKVRAALESAGQGKVKWA